MNLVNELSYKTKELDMSISKLADNGRALALAEKEYKMTIYED